MMARYLFQGVLYDKMLNSKDFTKRYEFSRLRPE
jgi:hypothetical protein